eukprot:12476394-Alexandrium_andersonii.AAC.1
MRQGACTRSMLTEKSGPSDGRIFRGPSIAGPVKYPLKFGGIALPPNAANGGKHTPERQRFIIVGLPRHVLPSRSCESSWPTIATSSPRYRLPMKPVPSQSVNPILIGGSR